MSLPLPNRDFDKQILALLEKRFETALNEEILKAQKQLEDRMRVEAARVAVSLHKCFEISTMGNCITIRIHTKDL